MWTRQNRIRVMDEQGFAEDGEVRRIISCTDIQGHQVFAGDLKIGQKGRHL